MAKSKSKSKKKSGAKKTSRKKVKQEDIEEVLADPSAEDEMTAGEKFLLASKPYWAHVALAVLSVILASVLWSTWRDMNTESASQPWRDLNTAMTQASFSGGNDVTSLKEMASENEGKAAAHWALLMAGDREVNRGVGMLARDRVGGLKLIGKGVESLQTVVDAPAASKTPMLQRRSTFMLGYAKEALGEFDAAKGLYQSLLDAAPESPYADVCSRGVARCSNTELAAVYDTFRNWEEATDVAPGPLVPDAPKLNIDEIKLPEGEPETFSGGEMKLDKPAETETETPAVEDKKEPVAEKPTETEAAKPAVEMPTETEGVTTEDAKPAVEAEQPAETPTAEADMPATEVPVETPAVEMPATDVPAETPVVETPTTEVPAVEVPTTEVPVVETPTAEPVAGGEGGL